MALPTPEDLIRSRDLGSHEQRKTILKARERKLLEQRRRQPRKQLLPLLPPRRVIEGGRDAG